MGWKLINTNVDSKNQLPARIGPLCMFWTCWAVVMTLCSARQSHSLHMAQEPMVTTASTGDRCGLHPGSLHYFFHPDEGTRLTDCPPTLGCGISTKCWVYSPVVPRGSAAKRFLLCKKAACTPSQWCGYATADPPKPQGKPFLGGPKLNRACLSMQTCRWPAESPEETTELVSNRDNWCFPKSKPAWLTTILFLLLLFVLLWCQAADLSYWAQGFITI